MDMDDPIEVCVRTARAGHLTLALSLEALPAFVDEHLGLGRAVIAESGDESLLIRVGREILDFFRSRRRAGAPKSERVTVTNPLRGGADGPQDAAATRATAAMTTQVLASAVQAQAQTRGLEFRNTPAVYPQEIPPPPQGQAMLRGAALNAEAEMRAWQALCEHEGEATARTLAREGAIAVRSTLWPGVIYLVRVGTIQVLRDGQTVSALCLQVADGGSVWDAVANRLSLLRAGADGEIQVWATANAAGYR